MQQLTCKMAWSFSFYPLRKSLNFKINPGGKFGESVEKCEKVPKRFCPLVVALSFFSEDTTILATLPAC